MDPITRSAWGFAVDLVGGEPPTSLHPTVWMGRGLGRVRDVHRTRPRSRLESLTMGMATMAGGVAMSVAFGALLERCLRRVGPSARATLGGVLLKPALSLRALVAAGGEVEGLLRIGDLDGARRALSWHLVSRETSRLTAAEVAGATIESLAENLSDSFVGPVIADMVGGLPAAYAYRFINTADAMLGYRTPELEWLGKAAARLDDAVNLVPARVSALLVALAAPVAGGSVRGALHGALSDAGRTPSPNAGWPMAAMAGALGVRLDKRASERSPDAIGPRRAPRHLYILNRDGRAPTWRDVARTRRIVAGAAMLMMAMPVAAAADHGRARGRSTGARFVR